MIPLQDHRAARLAALTAPDGWLNLVARIDLTPGSHAVGAAQDIRLPSGPDLLGTLTVSETGASFARPGQGPQPFLPVPDAFPQLRVDPFHDFAGERAAAAMCQAGGRTHGLADQRRCE